MKAKKHGCTSENTSNMKKHIKIIVLMPNGYKFEIVFYPEEEPKKKVFSPVNKGMSYDIHTHTLHLYAAVLSVCTNT